jgi:hypothetical protein
MALEIDQLCTIRIKFPSLSFTMPLSIFSKIKNFKNTKNIKSK